MDDNQVSFEAAYAQLRETVTALEAGNLPLAEATRLFEEGMRLAKQCNVMLSEAELKITKLQREYASNAEDPASDEGVEPYEGDGPLDDMHMPPELDTPTQLFDGP